MVTIESVVRADLLDHRRQHVVQFRGVGENRHPQLIHALPCIGVGHRHDSRYQLHKAGSRADINVAKQRELGGELSANLLAEHRFQLGSDPFLQPCHRIAEGLGELFEEPDDRLDLTLQVLEHGTDIVGDLPKNR
ncbi:hypothetical protein A5666_17675 [Mycolicibacterium fortuitum]|nr:hypothetical protein A5665_03405 [Mycolicibacterium fortuitum]OBI59430.1 hypothetical protein A5666_17675 [Mycolicibacterium fortuitum]